MIKTSSSTTRFLSVYEINSSVPILTLKHVHFEVWEDFKVPTDSSLDDLVGICDEAAVLLRDQVMKVHFQDLEEP